VKLSVRRMEKAAILEIAGDIDLSSSPEVRKALLNEFASNRTPRVVLNMERVQYIDSSGVASLIEGLKAARDTGSRFLLFGLSRGAREVLQLSRLLKIFEICDSEEQALSR